MANLLMPLQIERQYSGSLDANYSFDTLEKLKEYVQSALSYSGQILYCKENDTLYKVNNDKTDVASLGSGGGEDAVIPYIGDNGNWYVNENDTGVPATGQDGMSAYEVAVAFNGFEGTEEEWLESLKGTDGIDGYSPTVVENANNTEDNYKLDITTKTTSYTTPNLKGKQGIQGLQGIQGEAGKDGKDGTTYTPSIGEVTTVDSTELASASVSVNTETKEAVFNFAIPKGNKGTDGVQISDNETVENKTWSSKKTSSKIAEVETELKGNIEEINDSLVDLESALENKANKTELNNYSYLGNRATRIQKNDDLNNYITPGNYTCSSIDIAKTLLNLPTGIDSSFRLEVIMNTGDETNLYGSQEMRTNSNKIFIRTIRGTGGWSDWQELATMDKVPESVVNPTELDTNKFLKSGYYSLGDATKRTNLPMQNVGTLLVYYAGHYVIQEYILNANLRRFMRRSTDKGANWSAWTELATMDKVADVPNTVIVSENTKVKLNSNCYYTVINGVCYVTLWGFQCTEAGQYVVNSSMPKTRLTMKGICTYGSNGYEGGCAYVFYDGNGNNKLYVEVKSTNEPLYGSFSYPVAEN